jgi:hypothetical protein
VHYHIIPAPNFDASTTSEPFDTKDRVPDVDVPPTRREMHQKEFESREELDEDEGEILARKIGRGLARL